MFTVQGKKDFYEFISMNSLAEATCTRFDTVVELEKKFLALSSYSLRSFVYSVCCCKQLLVRRKATLAESHRATHALKY